MPDKRYIILLSNIDRMIVRQDRTGSTIVQFSVQLEILEDGSWRKAMRLDSAHGRPHMHVFYPDGSEHREFMPVDENNQAFTQAQRFVEASFQEVHERYKIMLERMIK